MKTRQVNKFLFDHQISAVGWLYAWAIAITLVLPLVLALVTGTIGEFSFAKQVSDTPLGSLFGVFIFAISMLTYSDFKVLIQNGISRMTFFKSQVIVLLVLTLIGNTINLVYGYLTLPLTGDKNFNIFLTGYNDYFNNPILAGIVNFLFSWLLLVALSMTGLAIGSLLSLFSKRNQRIILIAAPIALFVVLIFMGRTLAPSSRTVSWVADFTKFMIGWRDAKGVQPLTPWPLTVGSVVWAALMAWFSRAMFARKQLKRE
ncbi:hypothetical protein PL11_002185 [Lentilactobacillus curieae]|uniref:Uncharacterized protein n=1 Tax=Lentilactobacillus curieae TaxID=1138822 RepID=A0A1S6QGS4_9LACO|nr:hypothetical protein [Lentilactobacillus curieae]AQW20805.1 hypothetical protein PL11_002185 [Lentilactobacillus curieae]